MSLRTLIIGLDGATFTIVDELVQAILHGFLHRDD